MFSLLRLGCCFLRSAWAPTVDGQWQEWSAWSDCSVTCANGTQQRKRQCSAAAHGGSECRGHWAESRECSNPECTGTTEVSSESHSFKGKSMCIFVFQYPK